MSAQLRLFGADGVTSQTLFEVGLVPPGGELATPVDAVFRNTGTTVLQNVTVRVEQSGNSPAYLWFSGVCTMRDADGVIVGTTQAVTSAAPAVFAGAMGVGHTITVAWTVAVPVDAPLDGVGSPATFSAQDAPA